ncbi:MAG TPA: hypothetical protein VG815_05310 [Chloroflexota bacterium]|jgi:hypothetical protein|nr:hypothetical protein [Chloroflexota bacterium]
MTTETRRTTVVAQKDDLALLAQEARLQGTSLGRLLGELVGERANQVRRSRRPRVATFRANVSIAAEMDSDEDESAARPFRSR